MDIMKTNVNLINFKQFLETKTCLESATWGPGEFLMDYELDGDINKIEIFQLFIVIYDYLYLALCNILKCD